MRELIKAAVKTGSASIINIILAIFRTKIMATVLGPAGIGFLSLLDQTTQTAISVASFSGGVALTQGIANKEGHERSNYMATVFWILVVSSGFTVCVLVVFTESIARAVEMQGNVILIRWLAVPVLLNVILVYLNSTLNGNCAVGRMALVSVTTSGIIAFMAYPAAWQTKMGHPIAYVAIVSVATGGSALLALVLTLRNGWLDPLWAGLHGKINLESAKHFFRISGATIILSLMSTGVFLILRSDLASKKNYASVGLFDAAWGLSMLYVTLVLGSFGSYYMPRLSSFHHDVDRQRLISQVFRLVTLFITPLVITVIVCKPLVIQILYSTEFLPSLKLMRWMFIGDYVKVASWVVAMPALAYADMNIFFLTETFWNLGFLGLSLLSLHVLHNFQGIGIAFLFLYIILLIYYVYYSSVKHAFLRINRGMVISWLIGLGLVIGASIFHWMDVTMNWSGAMVWILIGMGYLVLSLTASERASIASILAKRRI